MAISYNKIVSKIPPPIRSLLGIPLKTSTTRNIVVDEKNGVIIVDDHKWAVDLLWHPETTHTILAAEAKKTAINEKENLYSINNMTQVGTTSTNEAKKAGSPVLASAIASQIGHRDILAAFPLDNEHYYILACENGAFRSGFENILKEESALYHFNDLVYKYRQQNAMLIAPEKWDIENAFDKNILEYIPVNLSGVPTLHATQNRLPKSSIYAIAGVIATAWGAHYLYKQYRFQQDLEQARNDAKAEVDRQARAQLLSIPVLPPMPSADKIRAPYALQACYKKIVSLPLYLPGWTTTGIDCDGTSVTQTLIAGPDTTPNWLPAYIGHFTNEKPAITWSPSAPENATLTWQLPAIEAPKWGQVDGQNPQRIERYLLSNMSEIYATKLYQLDPPVHEPVATKTVGNTPVNIQSPWTKQLLTLKMSGTLNQDILDLATRIQNAVFVSMHVEIPTWDFVIQENIYHYDPPNGPAPILKADHP